MAEGFKITRVKRSPYFDMNSAHYHTENEIYYLVSGKRRVFINDTIYTLNKGDLAVILKGNIHRTSYITSDSHERIALMFGNEYLRDIYEEYGADFPKRIFEHPIVSIPQPKREYIEELFEKLGHEYNYGDEFSNLIIKTYIQELLLSLIRYQKYNTMSQANVNMADDVIQEAARYISNNYNKNLSLETVAKHINMSATYFSKRFKEATGFGFKEYVINVRLREASKRLLETDEQITEIALNCGFNDSNYFGDVFKRVKGMAPSRYRKNGEFL